MRTEIKKKTGVVLDEKGTVISKSEKVDSLTEDLNNGLFNTQNQHEEEEPKEKKSYNDISDYKPTGKLVYNPEILEKIEQRVSFR